MSPPGAPVVSPKRTSLPSRFLGYRITNPTNGFKTMLGPPFGQVLVQANQPVPGKVYNVLQVAVANGTSKTFTASDGLKVRLNNQGKSESFPILTGDETWKPNQYFIFYVLTNKYYAVSQVPGGFQFDLGGTSTTLVPGPSGIFLRLKYNPATFAKTLDWIVQYGQGHRRATGRITASRTRPSTGSSPRIPTGSTTADASDRGRRPRRKSEDTARGRLPSLVRVVLMMSPIGTLIAPGLTLPDLHHPNWPMNPMFRI